MCKGPELCAHRRCSEKGRRAATLPSASCQSPCYTPPQHTLPHTRPFPTGTGIFPLARVNKHICILEQQQLCFSMTLGVNGRWLPGTICRELRKEQTQLWPPGRFTGTESHDGVPPPPTTTPSLLGSCVQGGNHTEARVRKIWVQIQPFLSWAMYLISLSPFSIFKTVIKLPPSWNF